MCSLFVFVCVHLEYVVYNYTITMGGYVFVVKSVVEIIIYIERWGWGETWAVGRMTLCVYRINWNFCLVYIEREIDWAFGEIFCNFTNCMSSLCVQFKIVCVICISHWLLFGRFYVCVGFRHTHTHTYFSHGASFPITIITSFWRSSACYMYRWLFVCLFSLSLDSWPSLH